MISDVDHVQIIECTLSMNLSNENLPVCKRLIAHTHIHTHTHTYIYIYICVCVYVLYVCVCSKKISIDFKLFHLSLSLYIFFINHFFKILSSDTTIYSVTICL